MLLRQAYGGLRGFLWEVASLSEDDDLWRPWCASFMPAVARFLRRHMNEPKIRGAGRLVGVRSGYSRRKPLDE